MKGPKRPTPFERVNFHNVPIGASVLNFSFKPWAILPHGNIHWSIPFGNEINWTKTNIVSKTTIVPLLISSPLYVLNCFGSKNNSKLLSKVMYPIFWSGRQTSKLFVFISSYLPIWAIAPYFPKRTETCLPETELLRFFHRFCICIFLTSTH